MGIIVWMFLRCVEYVGALEEVDENEIRICHGMAQVGVITMSFTVVEPEADAMVDLVPSDACEVFECRGMSI
jgi:hypothetical protein